MTEIKNAERIAVLVYINARHLDWFWKGRQGNQQIAGFLRY